jgi:hypothetical protein
MMPRGAVFINIGRGALVDESALIDVLRSGHLPARASTSSRRSRCRPGTALGDGQRIVTPLGEHVVSRERADHGLFAATCSATSTASRCSIVSTTPSVSDGLPFS